MQDSAFFMSLCFYIKKLLLYLRKQTQNDMKKDSLILRKEFNKPRTSEEWKELVNNEEAFIKFSDIYGWTETGIVEIQEDDNSIIFNVIGYANEEKDYFEGVAVVDFDNIVYSGFGDIEIHHSYKIVDVEDIKHLDEK